MELRSRGALKVVWRSSRHFCVLMSTESWQSPVPPKGRVLMALGYRKLQGRVRRGSRRSRRASKEIGTVVISPESEELQEPAAADGNPSAPWPPASSGEQRGARQGSGGADPAVAASPSLGSLTQGCCLVHHVSATRSGLKGKEARGDEPACPLAPELPGKEGRAAERSGKNKRSRSGARATRTASGGGARREPGKDAPGGAGGAGARGGVAEPAESQAAAGSAHPRARPRSLRTSPPKRRSPLGSWLLRRRRAATGGRGRSRVAKGSLEPVAAMPIPQC